MRKMICLTWCLMMMGLALNSCNDDENGEDAPYSFSQTPERDAQGTYIGTFTRTQVGTTEGESGEGTLTITPTDTAYVAVLKFESESLNLSTHVRVNIAHSNGGYVFSNHVTDNNIQSKIGGHINEARVVNTTFQLRQRQGRSTKVYNYSFEGSKP
ncbi:MAG: hypothetical protein IJK42_05185 [Prevotella sp.]|nr:hypothetical protein [Prevotella sp.]MBQ6209148.1 hypothetical protein [Prevotella sp.]